MVDFESARRTMVDTQLRTNNIMDRRVLGAMGEVPRELFVPESRRELAYIDDAHALTSGANPRYLPPAAPFGRLLQLAGLSGDDHVLDVGCASGYSTAVLARAAKRVVGVDDNAELVGQARAALQQLGASNATIIEGAPGEGHAGEAPYDLIVIEGVVETVPQVLFDQLKDGGRLVALIRTGATAVAHYYVRTDQGVASRADFNAMLPPLVLHKREETFVF